MYRLQLGDLLLIFQMILHVFGIKERERERGGGGEGTVIL